MRRIASLAAVAVAAVACRTPPAVPPPATTDQGLRDAVVLVCDAPARAEDDVRRGIRPADALAQHLTDGIGNDRVLTIVEGWKTAGIDIAALDRLMKEARVTACPLRETVARSR